MKALTIDIETTGLDYTKDTVISIVYQVDGEDHPVTIYGGNLIEPPLFSLLADPTTVCRGHNVKFDLRFLDKVGVEKVVRTIVVNLTFPSFDVI